jgi:diguanylate cyclase (GGDEF)-like protein/PAS domain S-box-containing protein
MEVNGGSYYQDLVESAPDAILVVNRSGSIDLVNRQAEALFGYAREELLGQPVELLVPERARLAHPSHRASYFADPRTRPMGVGLDLTARRKDGTEVSVDISLSPLQTAHGMVVSVAIRDVSDRKRAEDALTEAYQRLSASVRDLERHDREMTLVNEMGELVQSCLTGAEANEVIARYGRLLFPSSPGAVFTAVPAAGVFEAAATWGAEDGERRPSILEREECWALRRTRMYAVDGPDGGPACAHAGHPPHGYVCVPMMAQGEAIGLLHVQAAEPGHDDGVTFQSQRMLAVTVAEHLALAIANLRLRETLRHQSISDPLTGLFNRRYLQDYLARELHRAARSARPVSLVLADIDHFKGVNDEHGHGTGDEVLRAVARALEAGVRGRDVVCRVGGDEFVLILPDSPVAVAEQRAEHLRQAVRSLGDERDGALPGVTLSLGVAAFPDHGLTVEAVLRAADEAMYEAKERGRDAVAVATATRTPS